MAIKKYTNGSWTPASYRKYGTETDTITTLPVTIIGDGTPISSYTIKGNMEQSGTPTPSSPIYPSECGDLVTSGEHAGQYKLPLTLGSTTTDIYLGEVQSTRRVKKLVFDGMEDWAAHQLSNSLFTLNTITDYVHGQAEILKCSHYNGVLPVNGAVLVNNLATTFYFNDTVPTASVFYIRDDGISGVAAFKAYLAQQYANGTPVTIWYVLAEPTTGILNEPICKIGDYVDSVSGTGLATSGAGQAFDINTTLKPSEVDMTYHGWHEHEDTKYST